MFTHRPYFTRPSTVFEYPLNDPAANNEVFEYIGDSVLSLAVGLLTKKIYRACARPYVLFSGLSHSHHYLTAARLRVGPHAVSHPCHSFRSGFYRLNASRKSGRSLCTMLRSRVFPSIMAFLSACAPNSPSWSAYSAPYSCKVGLSFFSMTTYRLHFGFLPYHS